jgi:hypothetical protein
MSKKYKSIDTENVLQSINQYKSKGPDRFIDSLSKKASSQKIENERTKANFIWMDEYKRLNEIVKHEKYEDDMAFLCKGITNYNTLLRIAVSFDKVYKRDEWQEICV